jgi:hypothetical protein
MSKEHLDPRVRSLLERFLKAARITRKPYAIGGAIAMASYGFARETDDVDVFIQDEDRGQWFRALQRFGLTVEPLFARVQYAVTDPKYHSEKIRIDLLLPAEDPGISAILMPEEGRVAKLKFKVFPMSLLVISKLLSMRDKDHEDLDEMYERGLFSPAEVAKVLRHIEPGLIGPFLEKYL